MRVLLDENLPVGLAPELAGHEVETISRLGWSGITNGELLRRAGDGFDVLVTMDQNVPLQQNLRSAAIGVVLVRAPSNRLTHIRPLLADILTALADIQPGELVRVGD